MHVQIPIHCGTADTEDADQKHRVSVPQGVPQAVSHGPTGQSGQPPALPLPRCRQRPLRRLPHLFPCHPFRGRGHAQVHFEVFAIHKRTPCYQHQLHLAANFARTLFFSGMLELAQNYHWYFDQREHVMTPRLASALLQAPCARFLPQLVFCGGLQTTAWPVAHGIALEFSLQRTKNGAHVLSHVAGQQKATELGDLETVPESLSLQTCAGEEVLECARPPQPLDPGREIVAPSVFAAGQRTQASRGAPETVPESWSPLTTPVGAVECSRLPLWDAPLNSPPPAVADGPPTKALPGALETALGSSSQPRPTQLEASVSAHLQLLHDGHAVALRAPVAVAVAVAAAVDAAFGLQRAASPGALGIGPVFALLLKHVPADAVE